MNFHGYPKGILKSLTNLVRSCELNLAAKFYLYKFIILITRITNIHDVAIPKLSYIYKGDTGNKRRDIALFLEVSV